MGEVTYIPIPHRIRDPIPGLITLQLPLTVKDGESFTIDFQQHSGPTFQTRSREHSSENKLRNVNASLRKVLGAFRVAVAVKMGEPLLGKAVRNLAVLKFILQAIPSDSWHPIFVRWIRQLGDKIKDLGVDPDLVPPSADDPGVPGRPNYGKYDCVTYDCVTYDCVTYDCVTGKVSEVIFDCFGDFEGFMLETCDGCHRFTSREKGIAELVLRACECRLTISVCVTKGTKAHIHEIIVRCGDHC